MEVTDNLEGVWYMAGHMTEAVKNAEPMLMFSSLNNAQTWHARGFSM